MCIFGVHVACIVYVCLCSSGREEWPWLITVTINLLHLPLPDCAMYVHNVSMAIATPNNMACNVWSRLLTTLKPTTLIEINF